MLDNIKERIRNFFITAVVSIQIIWDEVKGR